MQNPKENSHAARGAGDVAVGKATTHTVPALSDTRPARLATAARRFLDRAEIKATMQTGTNGWHAQLPSTTSARLALYEAWPDGERCQSMAAHLRADLAEQADAEHVAVAVPALLAAFPTGERAAQGYKEALIAILVDEAAHRQWSAAAVAGGMLSIIRTGRFLPAAAELIAAVNDAQRELLVAAWAAEEAARLSLELRWSLEDAGLVDRPEGEWF